MESRIEWVAADGAAQSYWIRRLEGRSAPLLLLLHGAASNHTRWSELVDETSLGDGWDILRPDLRGNGRSMWRGRLDLEVWSRDLTAILEREGYGSAVVVGHSLGAQIAMDLASRHPERVAGLVLIEPVFPPALIGRGRRLSRLRPVLEIAARVLRGLNALGLRRRRFPDRDLRQLDEETRKALREAESPGEIARRYGALGPILRYMPTANYLQQLLATTATPPDLSAIDCPVLVILSSGVTMSDPEINRREIGRFPRAELVVVEADHWPLTERPRAVFEAIEAWVEKI